MNTDSHPIPCSNRRQTHAQTSKRKPIGNESLSQTLMANYWNLFNFLLYISDSRVDLPEPTAISKLWQRHKRISWARHLHIPAPTNLKFQGFLPNGWSCHRQKSAPAAWRQNHVSRLQLKWHWTEKSTTIAVTLHVMKNQQPGLTQKTTVYYISAKSKNHTQKQSWTEKMNSNSHPAPGWNKGQTQQLQIITNYTHQDLHRVGNQASSQSLSNMHWNLSSWLSISGVIKKKKTATTLKHCK